MFKLNRKSLPAIFGVLALLIGAWTITPRTILAQGETPTMTETAMATEGATEQASETATAVATGEMDTPTPVVTSTQTPAAKGSLQAMVDYLNSFTLDTSAITPDNVSAFDRDFVHAALAMNTAELQMIQIGNRRATHPEVRALLRLMGQMHAKDQTMLTELDKLINPVTTTRRVPPNVVPFLPGMPEYNLGFKSIDLSAAFVNKVNRASGGNFGLVLLDEISAAHAVGVEAAMAGQMNASNPSIQALAKHMAEEMSFHMLLSTTTRDRVFFHMNTPIIYPPVPGVPPPTATPTPVVTATETMTPTETETPFVTETPTATETVTETVTETPAATETVTETPAASETVTETPAASETPTP